jgi:hypothetical protein
VEYDRDHRHHPTHQHGLVTRLARSAKKSMNATTIPVMKKRTNQSGVGIGLGPVDSPSLPSSRCDAGPITS